MPVRKKVNYLHQWPKGKLACLQAVGVVVAAKHISDAILEVHGIGLGQVTSICPIHLIPKWPPFKYSFVFIQISP